MNKVHDILRRYTTKNQRRFIKFCIVGASGVPVNLFFTWLGVNFIFNDLGADLNKALSFIFGIIISIFTNFLLNDFWTWADCGKVARGFLGRLIRFYIVSSAAALIQWGVAFSLNKWMGVHYLIAPLCGIAIATAVNFVANHLWTFKDNTPEDGLSKN